ncbi:MAG: sulfite exporter TauE/SafE family protein, partial [Caldilineaceae bacterium]|nr:sulfite exporter TauE/SafE family protein [Caldilineaceae bacterium]
MSESFLLLATYGSVVVFVAFFIRSMTGFGSALISIPLLALLFDLKVVVPLEAILEVAISVLLLRAVYHTIDRRTVLPMMVGVAVGALLGVYGLSMVETPLLKRVFGVAIMGYALYLYRDQRPPRYQPTSLGWGFTAGLGGGIIGGTVGTSGPP